MKMVQLMAGASHGGAEAFFSRLVPALHVDGVTQTAIIRKDSKRAETLQKEGVETHQLAFGGMLDLCTPIRIKKLVSLKKPELVMSWMNRASRMIPIGQGQCV